MRVVVLGATGNVGTATVRALARDPRVASVVGVARRLPVPRSSADIDRSFDGVMPAAELVKVTWVTRDIGIDDLDVFAGADVIVHLAWMIQPSREEAALVRTNIVGTQRVLDAMVRHRVPALVYASSVGTYAPGPKTPRSSESWPATGIPSSTYSRHKAMVESMLDAFERQHPAMRVVRMRTSLVFQRDAASEIHRLFLGRLLPWHLPRWLRFVPGTSRLTFQATHAEDVADAYLRAVRSNVSGAFNIAAEPVLTPGVIARAVDGMVLPVPERLLRAATRLTYAARLQPSEQGWLDMATRTPLMDTSRAQRELGWSAAISATDALRELLDGIGDGAGAGTAPLHPRRAAERSRHHPSRRAEPPTVRTGSGSTTSQGALTRPTR
jgi:UDP-glucose 4-epimerase